MAGKKPSVLLLIDANALIHRFFHALPPFTAPDGQPTNALYGLSGVLLKILSPSKDSNQSKPDYIAAAFDTPEPTFREKEYKEYKAHRLPTANELVSQIILAEGVFNKFGVKTFGVPGFEADDIVGTLAERFKKDPELAEGQVVIMSGDNDILQLVDGNKVIARMFKTGITETIDYDDKAVEARFGIKPQQLPDYKGFVGDVSDNIPGVEGIGPKTAAGLLKEFGTTEEVFDSLAIVTNRNLAKKLEGRKEEALFSKHLATIRRDTPVPVEKLGELKAEPLDKAALKKMFERFGFKTLIERLDK